MRSLQTTWHGVTVERRKERDKELRDLCFSPNIIRVKRGEVELRPSHSMLYTVQYNDNFTSTARCTKRSVHFRLLHGSSVWVSFSPHMIHAPSLPPSVVRIAIKITELIIFLFSPVCWLCLSEYQYSVLSTLFFPSVPVLSTQHPILPLSTSTQYSAPYSSPQYQ